MHSLKRLSALLMLECRLMVRTRAFWGTLIAQCFLTGSGLIQAMRLYGGASASTVGYPEMARGLSPLDGILVPLFGSLYLATTLLFPFLAIRAAGEERRNGGDKLLAQLPLSRGLRISAKVLVILAAWCCLVIPCALGVVAWVALGGHVQIPEFANLTLGHALYGFTVAGAAFLAASLARTGAAGAILTLSFTLGLWALEYYAGSGRDWLRALAQHAPTADLHRFELGLFVLASCVRLGALGLAGFGLGAIWMDDGSALRLKWARSTVILLVLGAVLAESPWVRPAWDLSEDRRNSFSPAEEAALRRMWQPLEIAIHLSPEDSRYREFEAVILDKLRRILPRLSVATVVPHRVHEGEDDTYGLIFYRYAGKTAESRSTGPEEVLPLLFQLAGFPIPSDETPSYPGFPLVADIGSLSIFFYGVLPLLFAGLTWIARRPGRSHIQFREVQS